MQNEVFTKHFCLWSHFFVEQLQLEILRIAHPSPLPANSAFVLIASCMILVTLYGKPPSYLAPSRPQVQLDVFVSDD